MQPHPHCRYRPSQVIDASSSIGRGSCLASRRVRPTSVSAPRRATASQQPCENHSPQYGTRHAQALEMRVGREVLRQKEKPQESEPKPQRDSSSRWLREPLHPTERTSALRAAAPVSSVRLCARFSTSLASAVSLLALALRQWRDLRHRVRGRSWAGEAGWVWRIVCWLLTDRAEYSSVMAVDAHALKACLINDEPQALGVVGPHDVGHASQGRGLRLDDRSLTGAVDADHPDFAPRFHTFETVEHSSVGKRAVIGRQGERLYGRIRARVTPASQHESVARKSDRAASITATIDDHRLPVDDRRRLSAREPRYVSRPGWAGRSARDHRDAGHDQHDARHAI